MESNPFFEDMIIDTPEKARNLERAFEEAEKRGPLVIVGAHKPNDDPERILKFMMADEKTAAIIRARTAELNAGQNI
ncbi:MAG: hypothetical protein LBG62_06815 [Candidatus Methanoplasma sp.]|jgi:D-arabinose 1-dehydrogenase-like Zn-dependent alcohol dehydrogenase|nr:hypothetical protein [Candidatus Methanoplasma sp.]